MVALTPSLLPCASECSIKYLEKNPQIFLFLLFSLQIILHSMHKYQPRVHVIRKDFSSDLSPTKPVPSGDGVKTFNFPETVFTTVTAYQNQQVNLCVYRLL